MTPSDSPLGPISHTFVSQRLRLHYVDWGGADTRPLVLVHGGRDHCRSWDGVARALRTEHRVVAPDLRGHGDSEWAHGSPYTLPEFVVDLTRLVEHLGGAPVDLVGHSLGGATALVFAGVYPDRVHRLIAVDGFGPPPALAEKLRQPAHVRLSTWEAQLRDAAGRRPRRYASLDEAAARMLEANPHLDPERARHLTRHGARRLEDGTYTWKFDHYFRILSPLRFEADEMRALWGRVRCPTLLVVGAESPVGPAGVEAVHTAIPHAEVAVVEGAGHWVHHDCPSRFLQVVGEFLTE